MIHIIDKDRSPGSCKPK